MKAQVHFHGLDVSDAVRVAVDDKLTKLRAHHPELLSLEVTVEAPHRHHLRPEFHVRVEAHVPGHVVVSASDGKPEHEDVYLALRDAMAAARRQLDELSRRRRTHPKEKIAELVAG